MKIKKGTFPESLTETEAEQFEIYSSFCDCGSYKEDYERALKFAKEVNGEVYTRIDGEGKNTYYWKGLHYVNRFGFAVLGWSKKI